MPVDAGLATALGRALAGRRDVRLALLFGSRARGSSRGDSDVDLAVLGRDLDLLDLAAELSAAVGLEVTPIDLSRAGYPLLAALLRDGIVVHEGEPNAGACWRTRAILETETDRPWFERMRDAYLERLARGARGRS